MKSHLAVFLAYATGFTTAVVLPRADDAAGECPDVWTQISQDLTRMFVQPDGQCNDLARAAVRATFHDCGTWNTAQGTTGGCDGSLVLSAEENARPENRGLQDISAALKALATQRGVSVADMLAFAGSHGTVSCPLGPTVKTMVGRRDSSQAAPNESLLPASASLSADAIIASFADKGFSAPEVSALVGAHSSSKQFITDPSRAGAAQDRTPGIWDVDFYSDTVTKPPNVFVFQSDVALANDPRSGPAFKSFIGQQARWNRAFADSFAKVMLLGVPPQGLIDCTSALPPPRDSFPGANTPAEPTLPSPPTGGIPGKGPGDGPQPPPGVPTALPPGFPSSLPPGFPTSFPRPPTGGDEYDPEDDILQVAPPQPAALPRSPIPMAPPAPAALAAGSLPKIVRS